MLDQSENNMPKKAVAYCRFSSENQREESIEGQKRAIQYYAKENGFEIVFVYVDRARSGKSAQRPQFQQMIEDCKTNGVQAVLVYKLDRFSRDTADALHYEEILSEYDITLISVMEKLDASPTGNLMKTIIMGMNSFYVENMATDILRGMKENALQCLTTGGIAPLGYRYENKKLAVEESEAEIVRLIFSLHDQGNGYGAILDVYLTTIFYLL